MTSVSKAELHVHIEGTLTAAKALEVARRNGIDLPARLFTADETDYAWQGFEDFIHTYDAVAACLRTADDYRDITADYLIRSAAEGCVYAELHIAPTLISQMSHEDYLAGLSAGIDEARVKTGIDARMVATIVRHQDTPEAAEALARYYAQNPHPYVTGFGIAGIEKEDDIFSFAKAFQIAHEESGLGLTAHAGEYCGAVCVKNTLEAVPHLTRIGHGIRSIEDEGVLEMLKERGIVLEVCPTSNVSTGVVKTMADHPLSRLMAAGVKVTLASDDPPFFHTSIGGEYGIVQKQFGLNDASLQDITDTALAAAFR
ncbi:MAG: adenosine deaminase [Rhodospirillales bacterium]|nr:adenosine deaminase [Rhodospirillales bacterium]